MNDLEAKGFFESRIEIRDDGVYRSVNLWALALLCACIFFFLGRQLYLERMPLYAAILMAVLTVSIPLFAKIRYGKLGMPYVKSSADELTVFLPGDSRGKVRFALGNLREIQVYGRSKGRKYRFLMRDGTFADLKPFYGERAEQAVNQFLAANLPADIVVKILEPQSFFEEVRGDGP